MIDNTGISKQRNVGIDFLKFLAAFLVINSHIDIMYGKYSFLATGGTVGDVLFFFCSGYTLFLKPFPSQWGGVIRSFPNWYKRRINRIWPSLIVIGIIKCVFVDSSYSVLQTFFYHGYWFIDCIMLYYIVLYFIGSLWKWSFKWVYLIVTIITFVWFYMMDKPADYSMYHPGSIIKWLPYFLLMLMGAQLGKESKWKGTKADEMDAWIHLTLFLFYTALYYVILGVSVKVSSLNWIQPFSFFPILPCVYHIYKFACSPQLDNFIRRWYGIIATIGGLCLEIYLGHYFFITNSFNSYIPLNIIIMVILSIMFAYILRCGARLFLQTFRDEPYDLKSILRLY